MTVASQYKHLQKLADSLVKQGCTYRRTKSGFWFNCPDGVTTISMHISNHSDVRVMRNLKAEVRRAGLEWPKGLPG